MFTLTGLSSTPGEMAGESSSFSAVSSRWLSSYAKEKGIAGLFEVDVSLNVWQVPRLVIVIWIRLSLP